MYFESRFLVSILTQSTDQYPPPSSTQSCQSCSDYTTTVSMSPVISPRLVPPLSPQSCLGYTTALGVVSVLLVISLVGNATALLMCAVLRLSRKETNAVK